MVPVWAREEEERARRVERRVRALNWGAIVVFVWWVDWL